MAGGMGERENVEEKRPWPTLRECIPDGDHSGKGACGIGETKPTASDQFQAVGHGGDK